MPKLIDLTGKRFGRWFVIERVVVNKNRPHWLCKCDCGTERVVTSSSLLSGKSKSCGCLNREITSKMFTKDMAEFVGRKFDRLQVLEYLREVKGKHFYLCKCDCGNVVETRRDKLICSDNKSCGCYNKEIASKTHTTHGLSKTKAYQTEFVMNRNAKKKQHYDKLSDNDRNKIRLYYVISEYLGKGWEVDHIRPLSKGGKHHPDNLQVITTQDNRHKSNKLNYELVGHSIRV